MLSAASLSGRSNTNRLAVYCLLIGITIAINPAVGRSQWAVDSEYRFGFATAVAGPTLSHGTTMNPALLQGSSFSISISDEFALNELRSAFVSMVYTRHKFSYGVQIGSFGYSLYREWHGAGSVAYRFMQSKVGITLLTDRISVPGYGFGMAFTARLGTQLNLSEFVGFGAVGDRILIKRSGSIHSNVPTSWIAALYWLWIPQAALSIGVQSEIGHPPTGSLAISWQPIKHLSFSVAHEPTTNRWVAGIRIYYRQWSIPFGGTYHNDLGWSRHIGAGWYKEESQ